MTVLLGSAVSLAVLLVAVLGPWRGEVFAPGPLSQPHAQILSGQTLSNQNLESGAGNDRCAACHSVARSGLAAWFSTGGGGHTGVSQTQLCIECHHATIQPERALAAHNLTADELRLVSAAADSTAGGSPLGLSPVGLSPIGRREITWHDSMPRPSFTNEDVQCSACHREHGGKDADLTWMSSAQCQTCHQDRFASFAHGHPDWQRWPYGRGGQIAFNHAAHQVDHFAKEGKSFDCQSCHTVTTAGEIARTGSFETACAACHNGSLRLQAGQGIDLVALPTLDVDAVREAGIDVPSWPEAASGIDEVSLRPLTRMLLASDPAVAEAIDQLTDPNANLWQGPPSPIRLRATATVAEAVRALLDALAGDPQGSRQGSPHGSLHGSRLSNLQGEVERRLDGSSPLGIVGQLSPQMIATARDRWFLPSMTREREEESENEEPPLRRLSGNDQARIETAGQSLRSPPQEDLLLAPGALEREDPLLSDPLFSDPLPSDPLLAGGLAGAEEKRSTNASAADEKRFDAARMLPAGGWYRDDLQLAIRYRAAGHADPVLRAVVELASDATLAAVDRESLLEMPAVAACVDCHPAVRRGDDASWRSVRSDAGRRSFTRFSHRPHLHLPALSDCTHCHTVGGQRGGATSEQLESALTAASFTSEPKTATAPPHDFAPLGRATCTQCHTPQAAGDNCTKCHLYHVDP